MKFRGALYLRTSDPDRYGQNIKRMVLKELWATLKAGGVLFSSNPRGDNEEGWSGERYGVYHNYKSWREIVTAAGFIEIMHYYRPPHPGPPFSHATVNHGS